MNPAIEKAVAQAEDAVRTAEIALRSIRLSLNEIKAALAKNRAEHQPATEPKTAPYRLPGGRVLMRDGKPAMFPVVEEVPVPAEAPTECEQYYERAPGYGNLLPSKKHDADLHARIRELVGALKAQTYIAKNARATLDLILDGNMGTDYSDICASIRSWLGNPNYVEARAALARSEGGSK